MLREHATTLRGFRVQGASSDCGAKNASPISMDFGGASLMFELLG